MKTRFVLLVMLAAIFAGMFLVQAISVASAATTADQEYNITSGGDQYIGTGTTTPTTTTGSGATVGSANAGTSSLPSTGVLLLIPAAGLAATGLGALMMKKRGK